MLWKAIISQLKRRHLLLALIATMVIASYMVRYFVLSDEFQFVLISYFWDSVLSIIAFLGMLQLMRWMHQWLNRVLPFEKGQFWRVFLQLGFSLVVVMVLRWLFFMLIRANFDFETSTIFRFFAFALDVLVVCLINAWFFGEYFLEQWRAVAIEAEQAKRESIRSQYEALKNQVNPHFLFNSFTVLNELIFEDPTVASHYLEQLSKVYRYILKNNEVNQVTVEKEIEFLKSYIHLLDIRYGANFQMEIDLDEQALRSKLPPITLQILLENAVKHNIISKERPLKVGIFSKDNQVWVTNNFQPRPARETLRKLGLENIRNRYRLLNQETVEVIEGPDQWIVKLPMHVQKNKSE
jgi:two-component system LytT family sensor kinase